MKKIFTSLILIISQAVYAGEVEKINNIYVWTAKETYVTFQVDDAPVIKMKAEGLVIEANNSETIIWPKDKILRFTFEKNTTQVDNTKQDDIHISIKEHILIIENVSCSSMLRISSIDGKNIISKKVDSGIVQQTLTDLSSGIYIISIGNNSFKYLKK